MELVLERHGQAMQRAQRLLGLREMQVERRGCFERGGEGGFVEAVRLEMIRSALAIEQVSIAAEVLAAGLEQDRPIGAQSTRGG